MAKHFNTTAAAQKVARQDIAWLSAKEWSFKGAYWLAGGILACVVVAILSTLWTTSQESVSHFGLSFFTDTTWNPVESKYSGMTFLFGTLVTSLIALAISFPFSIAIAILLGVYMKEGPVSKVLKSGIELLSGIPSVIYGFWALFVLVPIIRNLEISIGVIPYGVGILAASLILAIMIIPYSAAISQDVLAMVPQDIKEAALGLGATPIELIWKVMLPYAKSGIIAGQLLALGRALGETMAVTMIIGNATKFPDSIFSTGNTIASILANEFAEAIDSLYVSSLMELALLLFFVSSLMGFIGKRLIRKGRV